MDDSNKKQRINLSRRGKRVSPRFASRRYRTISDICRMLRKRMIHMCIYTCIKMRKRNNLDENIILFSRPPGSVRVFILYYITCFVHLYGTRVSVFLMTFFPACCVRRHKIKKHIIGSADANILHFHFNFIYICTYIHVCKPLESFRSNGRMFRKIWRV